MVSGGGLGDISLIGSTWVSVPVGLRQDFRQSLSDRANHKAGGGDLADLLVFAGYTHRF